MKGSWLQTGTFALIAIGAGFCQEVQEPKLGFEVAVIKSAAPLPPPQRGVTIDNALVTMRGVPLIRIVAIAYHLETSQVKGPNSLSNTFDVMARIPAGGDKNQVPEMLQALLRERFALMAHTEERPVQGYIMTVKNPNVLSRWELKDGTPFKEGFLGQVLFREVTMSNLSNALVGLLGSPVSDQTKTEGKYTMWVDHEGDGSLAVLLRSLEEHGLKLQPGTFRRKYLVVESMQKMPTEN